jgi:hypothetical protein
MNRVFRTVSLALAVIISACAGTKEQPPLDLVYPVNQAVYTAGIAIAPNAPQLGSGAASWYRVSPALPAGLSLSETTGVISGTPTVASPAAQYLVTASNSGGSASIALTITVDRPARPVIVNQPSTQVVALGQVVTFSVVATGTGTLSYQWYQNGQALAGQTGASISSEPVVAGNDDDAFTVVVSDAWGGSASSVPAKIRLEGFIATGSMLAPRQSHAATKLTDGKVLVSGGMGATPLSSAELYDPITGAFAATGALLDVRQDHTSSLLGDGKVLLTGGEGGTGGGLPLATSELYDPVSSTFSASANMATPRTLHAATVLQDGRVLLTGGQWNMAVRSILKSAELYDPATGTFAPAGDMAVERYWHTSTLLPSGQVLITGGYGLTGGALRSAELYDPATGLFSATGDMTAPRYGQTATLLAADGVVLVAGGFGATLLDGADLYDPATGTFQATGSLNIARQFHTATAIPGGKVLITGGLTSVAPLSSAELYDPVLGVFTITDDMSAERYDHTATLLDSGEVLVVGGWVIGGAGLSSAELYAGVP